MSDGFLARLAGRTGSRAVPWLAVYEAGKWIYQNGRRVWDKYTPAERRRLGELVRKSKGRRSNLSSREQEELWRLVKQALG
jgi:hypothetical protein